jgi:hypothetical protein
MGLELYIDRVLIEINVVASTHSDRWCDAYKSLMCARDIEERLEMFAANFSAAMHKRTN